MTSANSSPAAQLPGLAASLRTMANQQVVLRSRAEALAVWEDAWSALSPAAKAFLCVDRHWWRRMSTDEADAGLDDLVLAARYADEQGDSPRFLGEVRQRVRQTIRAYEAIDPTGLPAWAVKPIDNATVELMNSWLDLRAWPARAEFLRTRWDVLPLEDTRADIHVLCQLYPYIADAGVLEQTITSAATDGLATTLAKTAATEAAHDLVRTWVASRTCTESQRFLEQHPELVSDPLHIELLAKSDDLRDRQHMAILYLVHNFPANDVFDAILDAADMRDLLFKVTATGDPLLINALWLASPLLAKDVFARPFADAVIDALSSDEVPEQAVEAARMASAAANERDRARAVQVLRKLNTALHSQSLQRVADILDASSEAYRSSGHYRRMSNSPPASARRLVR